jgi:outer membrane receptor protein involved in Fe transport
MLKKLFVKGVFLSFFASLSFTQDEQVTVIGSLIKGTPIDSGSPISTFDAESIEAQGNLNIVELIKMVPGSSGMDGESNQFGSNGAEGISNINMRGLGTQRTLVLINGKRQVTVPLRTGAGRSVNLHDLPMAALSRIEILKEGAAATYGSDAISGVVNFITDSTFEGLKVNFAAKGIPGAQDEGKEFSLTYGTVVGNNTNFMMSLSHQFKPELSARDTDYGIKPYSASDKGGWSTFGNPGTFVREGGVDAANAPTSAAVNSALGFGNYSFLADPGCNDAGGLFTSHGSTKWGTDVATGAEYGGFCRYQYSYFDNVQEEQKNSQLWMEFNGDIDGHDYHIELAYGKTDVPNWATSPSYPPNNPSTNTMPDTSPAMASLCAAYADFCADLTDPNYGGNGTNRASYHQLRVRAMAAAGNPFGNFRGAETESREYDTFRFAFDFEGDLTDDIQYSAGFGFSTSEGLTTSSDTQQGKFLKSLWGYGGPTCPVDIVALRTNDSNLQPLFAPTGSNTNIDANVVASNTRPDGCSYFNPTSTAIYQGNQPSQTNGYRVAINPKYDVANANSAELLRWMIDKRYTESTSTLMTADFIMQGSMGMLAGGDAAWAFGYERRDYNIETKTPALSGPTSANALTNIHNGALHPCDIPRNNATKAGRDACASNPVGLFMFLAPTFESDEDQTVDSLFAEFALPITDEFDMQLALRYEDYGSKDSVDPKVVMRWTPIDSLTLRFTGQTTFRAAHPDETSPTRVTALEYLSQTGAFKAVDITGNANLDPEEATTYNFGFITDFGTDNWTATLDFYEFDFKNPIITESAPQLAAAYAAGGAGKTAIQSQIFGGIGLKNDGSFGAGDIGRIQSNFVNGPSTLTNGIDLFIQYETNIGDGMLTAGMEANYVAKYSVDAYMKGAVEIAAAYECAGFFNIENSCRSMPEMKGKAFVNYKTGVHNFYGALNYVSNYDDRRGTLAGCGSIPALAAFGFDNRDEAGVCTEIAAHTTVDATYTYSWDDAFDISFSVYNLTDEQPPFTVWEMNYDPNTHSPLGRFIKAGFTYRMQ